MNTKILHVLAWLALLIAVPVFKIGGDFFLPLAIALVSFHPMLPWFLRLLKDKESGKHDFKATALASILYILIIASVLGGIVGSASYGLQQDPDLLPEIRAKYTDLVGSERVTEVLGKIQAVAAELIPILPGIAIFFFLAWEYPPLRLKLKEQLGNGNGETILREFERDGRVLQKFWLARSLAGFLTGASVGLALWLMNVPLAWLWGMLNFLLNYIPTVGSFIGVTLPVGFSMVTDDGSASTLQVALVVGGIQTLYGTFLDPLIQDKFLPMSSLMIFVAILFWGWMWGPWGALIGVPLTFSLAKLSLYHPIYRQLGLLVLQTSEFSEEAETF